jgi:hypothetical protein
MGDRTKLKAALVCAAALAGGVVAAAVASAQGPGDYEPPPTTTSTTSTTSTTTLPGPGPGGDTEVEFRAKANARVLRGKIKVKVACEEQCTANAHGKVRTTNVPGLGNGKATFKLGTDEKSFAGGGTGKLVLKVPRRARRVSKRAIGADGRVRARIAAEAADAAGNVGVEQIKLTFNKVK